jgi:hypothetical protein
MNATPAPVLADDGLYLPVPPPPGGVLTLVHLIGWAACAACLVGIVVIVAAMVVKHHRGHAVAVEPGCGEPPAAPAPLGLFFLGYVVIGTFGAVVGLVV